MNVWMKLEKPKEAEATLTITMRLSEWEELASQLPREWPSWELGQKITSTVHRVSKTFTATEKV